MRKTFKRIGAILLCVATALTAVGCNGGGDADEIDTNYQWLDMSILDSSDLDDYAGSSSINLRAWSIGKGDTTDTSTNDVVYPEIKRVTGVQITEFVGNAGADNNAAAYDKFTLAGTFPDVAFGTGWHDPNEIYDLTDLIEKYCPTIMSKMPDSVWSNANVTAGVDGKVYGVPFSLGNYSYSSWISQYVEKQKAIDPSYTEEKFYTDRGTTKEARNLKDFDYNENFYPHIYVREDVLKAAYPNAKTTDEFTELYQTQGNTFTRDDIFDVEITSAEQFRTEFLQKINDAIEDDFAGAKKFTVGGKKIGNMLITEGSGADNWSFMGILVPKLLGAGGNHTNACFQYWDVSTQQIELMLKQDFYADEILEWAELIHEGKLVSNYGVYTGNSDLKLELNQGKWAIAYGTTMIPSGLKVKNDAGETINYRSVYLDIPVDHDRFEYFTAGAAAPTCLYILKNGKITEEQIPQILQWLDYQASDLADKVYAWGPRSAGLFNEDPSTGERTYKDATLAEKMINGSALSDDIVKKYNLSNGKAQCVNMVFSTMWGAISIYHPRAYASNSSGGSNAKTAFNAINFLPDDADPIGVFMRSGMEATSSAGIKEIEEKWASRPGIELQMTKWLVSMANDTKDNFDYEYNKLLRLLDEEGWTDEYFHGAYTRDWLNLNREFISQFTDRKADDVEVIETEEDGCSSSIAGTVIVSMIALLGACAVVVATKKKED